MTRWFAILGSVGSYWWRAEVWGLEPEVENSDDGDVLAPAAPLVSETEEDEEPDPEPDDGGYSDPDGIVRLWFTDDRLSRVRVSARWREKLAQRPLDSCFALALAKVNMRLAEVPARKEPTYENVDFSQLPRVSADSLAAFRTLFEETRQRWDEAIERRAASLPAKPLTTIGSAKGVTVKLDGGGRVASVSFQTRWLASADHVSIRRHVMRASDRARARFVPIEDDQAEMTAVEAEYDFLLTAFEAMLNPKERM